MSKTEPTSWREVIKIHPACDLFPMMMTPDELKALGEDIKRKGMTAPIVWWTECEADIEKMPPPKYQLIDGRNRLDAMEMVGIKLFDANGKLPAFYNWVWEEVRYGEGVAQLNVMTGNSTVERTDPYEYVLSANARRRHLTAEQKRDVIAKVLKAKPGKSNRAIARQTKVDDKTVAAVRGKLEATAEIPQLTKTLGADGKVRTTAPTRKPRRTADEVIADRKAQATAVADRAEECAQQAKRVDEHVQNAAHAVELVEPKQSDIERVLPDADRLVLEILERNKLAPGYAKAVMAGIAAKLDISGYPDMLRREPTIAPDGTPDRPEVSGKIEPIEATQKEETMTNQEMQEMPMTKEERQQFLSDREEAGRRIDPNNAEVTFQWTYVADPYGIWSDLSDEEKCIGRVYYVRTPDGDDGWVAFKNLPDATRKELRRKMSAGEGEEDDFVWRTHRKPSISRAVILSLVKK